VHNVSRTAVFRTFALAFWIACVVYLLVPAHGTSAMPFHGGEQFQPKYTPARGL
jgi:hypothetical protein